MKKEFYVKPDVEIVNVEFEGVIASSDSLWGMDDLPSDPGASGYDTSYGESIWDKTW